MLMPMLTLKAYAKINLTLEVLGRRNDGYHDTASIMQTIDLCDTVSLAPAPDISLSCDDATLETPDNLALRAANMLRDASGYSDGAHIAIQKRIPVSAGLGGGSSDAAATLCGLNSLWQLGMRHQRLEAIAADLGSDVPFLLKGGSAIALGRGERVRRLPKAAVEWLVVLTPDIQPVDSALGKTAAMYGMLTPTNYTGGLLTRKLEGRIRGGGDVPPQLLFNVFDNVAFDAYPGMERCWNTFSRLGAREIHLSGSGPSIYALVDRREVGVAMQLLLKHQHGWDAHLVSAVPASPVVSGE